MFHNQPFNYLFHVGNPCAELPHLSMERVEKLHTEKPDVTAVIILWDQKDVDQVEAIRNKEKTVILHWKDDSTILNYLLDNILKISGAQIVCPRWYICTNKHITRSTGMNQIEKCPECQEAVTFLMPEKERFEAFAKLFSIIIKLANFDTTSGMYLNQLVNPIKNLLLNMRNALGCTHEPAVTLESMRGLLKDKPAIICGAGPSLEDALPHLKRIQDKTSIICVGRSFRLLRSAGIRVDYTISVEMFEWDAAIFDGLTREECGDTVMAYASVGSWKTTEAWKGKKVCLWDIETAKILGRDDHILGGNSVSHHMLNFTGQILEADPIILCGIDLAYAKPKTHAEGTIPDGWPQDQKERDIEYQQELFVPCTGKGDVFHPECHRVPVALGGGGGFACGQIMVRSSYAYENFANLFTVLIHKHGKKVFNACPNGQKIVGVEYLDLATYFCE